MSVSPPFRTLAPVLLLLALSCKGGKDGDDSSQLTPTLDIPEQWQSKEASIVMRVTNASTTSTEVRRALNELANGSRLDPTDQGIDPLHLLMRLPETDEAGVILAPDASLSTAELLAGSSVEQAVAFRDKIIDGDGVPFPREESVDACGNEMIMSVLSPHAIQAAIPQGAQDQDFWPTSCPNGLDCKTVEPGSWDVALGELRFDGMIDMVVNLFPDVRVDPVKPGAFGHLTALFLSDNNPSTFAAPLVANINRMQINMTGVWELDRAYVDPVGYREIYKFPHRTRELTSSDIFVFLEGFSKGENYWESRFGDAEKPAGLASNLPIAIDVTAPGGEAFVARTGGAEEVNQLIHDALVYQIGAAISCPSVRETKWSQNGPVEFFLCPGIAIDDCIATEDVKDGACKFFDEPVPSIFNPLPQPFERVIIPGNGASVPISAAREPRMLSSVAPIGTVLMEILVDEGTSLHLKTPERIVDIRGANNAVVPHVLSGTNDHCPDELNLHQFDLGAVLEPGAYTVTLNLASPDEFDEVTGEGLIWFYLSSVNVWKP